MSSGPNGPASVALTTGITVVGAMILLVLPLLNGGPFFYFDSSAYIEQLAKAAGALFPAEEPSTFVAGGSEFGVAKGDWVVKGGRSIYYSVPAYLGWITSIWLPAVLQALTLSWLVVQLFQRIYPSVWISASLIATAIVTFLSSAAFFAGLIMPDIWVGLMVLALALVWVFGSELSGWVKFPLFAIMAFGALTHNSHLALLAAIIVVFAISRTIPALKCILPKGSIGLPMLALVTGIAGQVAFSTAVRVFYDAQLVQLPHLTAHLVDLGPGARFAQESCPESGYAICEYAEQLPVNWIAFLFDKNQETGIFAAAPQAIQAELVDEQLRFAIGTFLAEPFAVLSGLVGDGLAQLWMISMQDVPIGPSNQTYIASNFPSDLSEMVQDARIYQNPALSAILAQIIQLTTALSVGIILLWTFLRVSTGITADQHLNKLVGVAVILILGVVLNGLICGVLASPYGRFQARIVWLIPLLAALVWTEKAVNWRTSVMKVMGST